jgi:pimeloyl-ACP methyl ester carboxylesterase
MANLTDIPPHLDFRYADALPAESVADGRLLVARTAEPGAPTVLWVHGAFHGAWCYAHYLKFFASRGVACAALDLPGHGGLAQDADFLSIDVRRLAECVGAACEHIGGPVIVVGHSMGALPVLLCATQRPVAGVILLAPSPPGNLATAKALPGVASGQPVPPPNPDAIGVRFLGGLEPAESSQVIARRLCAEGPEIINDRYLLRVFIDPQKVRVPGLCLEAELDTGERHPPGQDRAVADMFGFDYQMLGGQPHCMMYGPAWRAGAEVIFDWVARGQA